MSEKSQSKRINQRRSASRARSLRLFGGLGVVVLAVVGLLYWQASRPNYGEVVTLPPDASVHVDVNSDPGPYPTDPPAGGKHYPETYKPGFYNENDSQAQQAFPAGYLNHNLEHGYVIFWYNCAALESGSCDDLKSQIRQVMNDLNGHKLIAFPWNSLSQPVVMTSWGRLQRFETFNPQLAAGFVRANLNKAPEPEAD